MARYGLLEVLVEDKMVNGLGTRQTGDKITTVMNYRKKNANVERNSSSQRKKFDIIVSNSS